MSSSVVLVLSRLFCFSCYGHHRALHSFPTRRSSDLADLQRAALLAGDPDDPQRPDRARDRLRDAADLRVDALPHPLELPARSEEHTSELQSRQYLVCRLLLEKKKQEQQDDPRRASYI